MKSVYKRENLPYSYMEKFINYLLTSPTYLIILLAAVAALVPIGEVIIGAMTRRRILNGKWYSPGQVSNIQNRPGCYVITIWNDGKIENVYSGQSVDVQRRIKEHLSGHGNKKVYQDILRNKEIRIYPVYCRAKRMNRLEKKLIRSFRARKSYNIQRGGAKRR